MGIDRPLLIIGNWTDGKTTLVQSQALSKIPGFIHT